MTQVQIAMAALMGVVVYPVTAIVLLMDIQQEAKKKYAAGMGAGQQKGC